MIKKTLLIFAVLLVALAALAALYISRGQTEFARDTVAAEVQFETIVKASPDKKTLIEAFRRTRLQASPWKPGPGEYYTVYRSVSSRFDAWSDQYYRVTGRGTRRLLGLVFFDDQDHVTTYTLQGRTLTR